MVLPVYIDDRAEGTAALRRDRTGAVVDVRLRDVGRVVRLTLYGEGEFYLGIPEPWEGELRLTRRLPPREAERLPAQPAYAAESRREEKDAPPEPARGRRVLWQGGRPYYF